MNLAVLFSGGKDSALAWFYALQAGYKVKCLITLVSANPYSWMFHTPNTDLTCFHAKAADIALITKKTHGEKEKELSDLKKAIKEAKANYDIQGIITGSVASAYQASRIQRICKQLDVECFNPLWQLNQFQLLKQLIKHKFRVIITGIFAEGLHGLIGKMINPHTLKEIKRLYEKYKINPAGEGGEFETFTLDTPFFKYRLKIKERELIKHDSNLMLRLKVGLVKK